MRITVTLIGTFLCIAAPLFADGFVSIPDPQLNTVIRQQLNKPTGELTSNDMAGLTQLQAHSYNITDLSGLEAATNLNFLDLYLNEVSDISPLLLLDSLETLNLSGNRITNVFGLGALWRLTSIGLGGSALWFGVSNAGIADLRPLSGLTNLQFLGVAGNHLIQVGMSNLPALQFLDVRYCKLPDVLFVTNYPNLSQLAIDGNLLTNIAPVTVLPKLKWLTARENLLTNIPPLHLFNLPLVSVGLAYNYIDLNYGSAGRQTILSLLTNGVQVEHGGQTYSPRLTLVVTNSVSPGASGFVEFYGDGWSRYVVEESLEAWHFGLWAPVTEVHAGSLEPTRVPVNSAGPAAFFRLQRTAFGAAP